MKYYEVMRRKRKKRKNKRKEKREKRTEKNMSKENLKPKEESYWEETWVADTLQLSPVGCASAPTIHIYRVIQY